MNRKRSHEPQFGICGGQNGNWIVFYVFSRRSLNAIVTRSKNCPFAVNSTHIRQQWHLTGYVSTIKCASIVGCRSYISQLKSIINSQWQLLGCDITAFSERNFPLKNHTTNVPSPSQSTGVGTTHPATVVAPRDSVLISTLFRVITQRVVVISYRRFGTTHRSHFQDSWIFVPKRR